MQRGSYIQFTMRRAAGLYHFALTDHLYHEHFSYDALWYFNGTLAVVAAVGIGVLARGRWREECSA